jgi:hypothetical protein
VPRRLGSAARHCLQQRHAVLDHAQRRSSRKTNIGSVVFADEVHVVR